MNAVLRRISRPFVGLGKSVGQVWLSYNQRLVAMKAAGLAFYFLLGLIPFLFLTTAISGYVFRRNPEALSNVSLTLLSLLPPGIGERLLPQIDAAVESWHAFGILGILSLCIIAMGLFEAIDWSVNGAMGTRKKVGFLKGRLIFLAYLTGAMLFFTLAAVADYVFQLVMATPALHEFAQKVQIPRRTVSMAAFAVFLFILYLLIPLRTPKVVRAIAVALGIAIVWGFLQKAGATITIYISRRHAVYGALAGGALFLTWMYLLAMLILMGATILDVWDRRTSDLPPDLPDEV